MNLLYSSPKTLVTVLLALGLALVFQPALGGSDFALGIVTGLAVPIIDGLLWGKDRWDQHPVLYLIVGVLYFGVQVLIGREARAINTISFGMGAVAMQALLHYLGKVDKNA